MCQQRAGTELFNNTAIAKVYVAVLTAAGDDGLPPLMFTVRELHSPYKMTPLCLGTEFILQLFRNIGLLKTDGCLHYSATDIQQAMHMVVPYFPEPKRYY